MNDIISKWADFSSSETKPLFWMLLGPLLMMLTLTLTLALSHLSNPFLPLLSVVGLILSWKYRLSGFSLTLMVLVFYFALSYFFGHKELFLWKVGWGLSLTLGLTISYLSMEELKSYYARLKSGKEKTLQELQISLHSFEEKAASEKRTQEKEIETFKEELTSSREEVESLLSLVEASRIESDKVYKQSELLSTESLEMHRAIETLKIDMEEKRERLIALEKEHQEISLAASERLKTLNTYRVELEQARLLNESHEKQLKKAREYFLSQKKPTLKAPDKNQLILQTLEKDKGTIKKSYNTLLSDYQKLKTVLDEGKAKIAKAPSDALSQEIQNLTLALTEKKKTLEMTKSELISIEREIFVVKKGFQEKGVYV